MPIAIQLVPTERSDSNIHRSPARHIHIVHVTEALGGGVLYLLHQLIKAQIEAGFEVTLIHSVRKETPDSRTLDQLFPPPISRIVVRMTTNISLKADLNSFNEIAKTLRTLRPNILHLHSSKAGALGRVAARFAGLDKHLYYSPHGFSFLRRDVSMIKRAMFFSLEVIAGLFGGKIIASCNSEGRLANKLVGHRRVNVVENCTDASTFSKTEKTPNDLVKVISAGRLCYQKAPWLFWKLSALLSLENAKFCWIGEGELRIQLKEGLAQERVQVSGWVDRDCLWREMHNADIFVMTSLWEGMPLTLLDAQAIGLPAVVSDVMGCRDVVINGVTGFVCRSDAELVEKTRELIRNAELRTKMGRAAINMTRERFSITRMHGEILNSYGN